MTTPLALTLAAFAIAGLIAFFYLKAQPKRPKGISATAEQAALPEGWHIGPVIGGLNYSTGPTAPVDNRIEISPDAEPHYITFRHGSLAGKRDIRFRYRIDAPEGARFVKEGCPNGPFTLTLYFQARDPYWLTDGNRWWFTPASVSLPHGSSEGEIIAPLDGRWTGVETFNAIDNQGAFDAAKFNADRVGFTLGDCSGYGHGFGADRSVTLTILDFEIRA